MNRGELIAQLSIGLVLLALLAVQIPEGGSFLLLPALLLVYSQRSTLHIEPELKRIGILFLLYVLFFSFVSTDPTRSAKGAYDIVRGLLAFFPALWLGRQLTQSQGGWTAVFIGLAFILAHFAFPGTYGDKPIYGFYENPNNIAVTLVGYLFVLFALYPKSHSSGSRPWSLLAYIGAIGITLFLLVLANSRGAWLGVALALSLITLLHQNIARRVKIGLIFAIAVGLAALVALVDWKGFGYGTVGARLEIWRGLWTLTLAEHPWLGYGINYVKDVMTASGLPTLTAHNILLEIFVSSGLVGLAAFAYISYRLIAFLLKQHYATGAVLYAGIGGLTAFLVMGQFDLKFASFKFIAMTSCFLGLIYSQRLIDKPLRG